MTSKIDHSHFNKMLANRFPEIHAEIDDCARGLLHLEVHELGRATQRAIDDGDRDRIKACFTFVDEVFRNATPDVKNAIIVSYLEHLHFGGRNKNRALARSLLTPRLAQILDELEV